MQQEASRTIESNHIYTFETSIQKEPTTPIKMKCLLLSIALVVSLFGTVSSLCQPRSFLVLTRRGPRLSAKGSNHQDDDDDDHRMKQRGLDEALRRLDELGEDALKENTPNKKASAPRITVSPDLLPDNDSNNSPSLESEAKVYGELMGELDENEQSESYNEMMQELGGQAKQSFDTYSSVLQEMGGTPSKGFGKTNPQNNKEVTIPDFISQELLEEKGTEKFMENALKEAIKDVKLNNPEFSTKVLSDESIMSEIEKIFEEGNKKLEESIEEIKREQVRSSRSIVLSLV